MKPLKQANLHLPSEGIYGDCHRAVLASILELPLKEVPHFNEGGPNDLEFYNRTQDWLKTRGLTQIYIAYEANLEYVFKAVKSMNPDTYYILGGTSKTGVNHSVVCLNDEIVHDPSINDSGIIGPCDDGLYWVTFLGSIVACKSKEILNG